MGQSAGYVHISVRNAQRRADGMSRRGQARAGLRLAGGTDAPDSQTAPTPVLAPNGIPGPQAVARENEARGFVIYVGDVGGIGERGEGVGELVLGQAGQGARRHELVREAVALLLGAVDPLDGVRLRQLCDLSDPLAQLGVVRGRVRQGAIRERGGGVVSHGGESSHWGPGPFRPVHSDACTAEARTTSLWPHGPAMVPEPGYHGRAPATPPTQTAADRRFALRRRGPVVFYEFEPLRRIG